ncbi:hypothetical protein [Nostoc sp. 'Lobaria pulmonaria (5183) cyanobiont']|uniref:hypothetical protein n=1 Tax=Nostoc sp. 'Lobaria pulmonaria (5183) cyanobiont' TaxID=1618022 RepID=UPI000CF3388A|nr:hypothetical protein [Nostoc sp. 'Lobaria pulmonaria (5183) cyanobiont']AVH72925.1 hypothetical protein NLP_4513 [Nostoc sp. 'Lobaria pulmonaria (5183) cyanobiont']
MSYVSLLRNIPEILSQPIGIAAIASLGIHGAIAMIVPLMPMESNKPKETASSKTVGLLELSQADQNRLPQSTPQIGLQQLPPVAPLAAPNFSVQPGLTPLAPSPSSQLVLPPLPASSNNYRVSSLPTRQSLRMIPSDNLRFDASKFDSSKFNTSARFSRPVPRANVSENVAKYEPPKPLAVNRLPELQSQQIPADLLRNAQPPILSDSTPVETAQVNTTSQPMTQPINNNASFRIAQNPLINSLKQAPTNGGTLIGTRGSTLQTPDLSAKGTQQAIAQLDSYANLRKEVQQQYPNAEQKPVIRQTLSTDKSNLEGAVLGVLVVDPDGKVLDIKFQDKLISPELQLKARQYFNKQSPKGDKQISSYPFNLRFQSSTSNLTGINQEQKPSSLSAPGINNNQITPSPAATFKPLPNLQIRNNLPTSSPTGTLKPLTAPAATPKPLSELQIKNNQPTPSSAATTSEPLLLPKINQGQSTSAAESDKKLVERLREVKESRQKSNSEK